ncbi:choice-of-anchor Q domain-containing protein [Rhodopirellula europaea]|uniref:Extracellular nuclease n=1 Tax=Rhodopirellula europaea SH398 TaxID=1263868 RepID=M5SQC2_9BACT|nr:choice-of-anchor Q domain-containing protein [Rhodopirellula europaea]EMI28449.1 extracellular nuclease [Rhodopirellula europaea SH398]
MIQKTSRTAQLDSSTDSLSRNAGRKLTRTNLKNRRRNKRRTLRCESLEARRVLTSYLVDTVADEIADDGFVSLREAIQAANTNSAVGDAAAGEAGGITTDTIRFDSSLADAVITLNGSELEITDALRITLGEANSVTIDADGASRVVRVADGAGEVSIRDLTLTGGVAEVGGGLLIEGINRVLLNDVSVIGNEATGAAGTQGGGGIFNVASTLTIRGGSISDNVASGASGSGGGLFSAAGDVVIRDTNIQSNTANRAGGGIEMGIGTLLLSDVNLGGISRDLGNVAGPGGTVTEGGTGAPGNGGGLHVTGDGGATLSSITVTGGLVGNNIAATEGGGLWNQSGVTMSVSGDARITGNRANGASNTQGGGGIFNNGGTLTVTSVEVSNNATLGVAGGGGGIATSGGFVSIDNALIAGNFAAGASGSGGGLLAIGDAQLNVVDSEISGNVASRAGGGIEIATSASSGNALTLLNVALSENNAGVVSDDATAAAPGNGGALHVTGPANTQIVNSFINENIAAREGGGVWNDQGVMTIENSDFFANSAFGDASDDGGGAIFNNGGTVNVADTSIDLNFAEGLAGSGGGILSVGGRVSLFDTSITRNFANRAGGGIESAGGTRLDLESIDLIGNVAGPTGSAAPGNGGGIHVTGTGDTTITGGSVLDNSAAREGGGLWNDQGTMTVVGTLISENVASGGAADDGGGGIFNNGGTLLVSRATISMNAANGVAGSGGGVLSVGGQATISDSTLTGNVANRAGGGIEVAGGTLTELTDTDLIDNVAGPDGSAAPGNGGGLHVTGGGDTTITGGDVRSNFAALEGGGLWNGSGTMTVDGTTIRGNVASGDAADDGGGGIFNNGGTLIVTGAMITSNAADGISGSGGGVLNLGGTATISDTAITGNVANRAGGGIESTSDSTTTLTNVSLDGNNAGVAVPGAALSDSLLAYSFDGSGTSATPQGTAAGAPELNFIANGGAAADLRGGPGSGVSGAADDFAFDNTASNGITGASRGEHAADFDGIDALDAFTLSGWFMLPSTATESIGRQDALIENGVIASSGTPSGFRLRGGDRADSGTLQLTVNGRSAVESSDAYTEIGEYVFFAVSYDGTATEENVKFYKGTVGSGVQLVDTFSLDAGPVVNENIPLTIGVTQTSGLTLNPFNGLLDNIRIDSSAVDVSQLESIRFGAIGLTDSIAANPGNGGGLHISGNGVVEITDGTVNGNLAAAEGGGLWNSATGRLVVDGTLISGNTASEGGGVYTDGGSTVLTDVDVADNTAKGSGGGIYSGPSDALFSALSVTDSTISGNTSGATEPGTGGGGIFAASNTVVTDTDIVGNTAVEGSADGGGILIVSGDFSATDFSITGGEITGNQAARAGGGVENSSGFFTAIGTDFIENSAGVNGGALHQSGGGILGVLTVINDAVVRGNTAVNEGGGFWASSGDGFSLNLMSVSDSLFEENTAMFGGAVFGDGMADVSIDRTVFTNNSAVVNGGGIAIEDGSLFLADSVFTGNSAEGNSPGLGGGAIFTGAENQILNTDLINNTASMPLGNGGGILVTETGSGTYFGGTIQGNTAGRAGGGIEVSGQLTLDQGFDSGDDVPMLIDSNTAGINGGGLHISGAGEVTIRRAFVTGNMAAGEGGGLWNSAAGTLDVSTTTLEGNVASGDDADQGGGAIFSDGGFVSVDESLIIDNLANGAAGSGGAILAKGDLTVTTTSITGNIAVRAGGGIEIVGDGETVLTDVNLDRNSAGLDRSLAGANVPAPLLAYGFNETGTSANASGSAANAAGDPMLNFNANGNTNPADLHGGSGSGVSGEADDLAFDNTASSGFFNAAGAQHSADFDAIDTLEAFTLSGWFQLPSGGNSIGNQDGLIENGSLSGSNQGGFRLRAGAANNASTLRLTVDGTTVESDAVYTETGEYVFFAVSYDGTATNDNVKFFKGTSAMDVALVSTHSLNAGPVNDVAAPLVVGKTPQSFFFNPFNGLLDNIRIDGSALSQNSLEFVRADAAGQATGINANPGNGGGLHVSGSANVTVTGGTVSGNFAASEGGGLWNGAGLLTVDGTTIESNVATGDGADNGGGGIFNNAGDVTISNATIEDNVATGASGSGGGLLSLTGEISITDSSFDANGANRAGGGIEIVDGTVTLTNTDLVDNDVNGVATEGMAAPGNGGGLHVSGVADIVVDGGLISGNVAASEGGGLWNQAGSTLTILGGAVIQTNTALGDAADNGGGGVFNNGGVVDIRDASIVSNFADGASGSGGGLLNVAGGVVTITDSTISRNVASRAGGGIEDNSVPAGTVATGNSITLVGVTLDRNNAGVVGGRAGALFAAPGNGGGLHISGAGNVLISTSTVADNVAANEGGGLWNSVGILTVDSSTVQGNETPSGGGIYNNAAGGDVVVTNSTISGNSAETGGGIESEAGSVTLTSSTIAFNDADAGGGVNVVGGTLSIESSIVGSNSADTGPNINGAATSVGNNVIGNTSGATLSGTSASDRLNVNPGIAPLGDNGGPTMTHSLIPGSPALGNGDPAGVAVDQRGVERPQGVGTDSGSFESTLAPSANSPSGGFRSAADVDGSGEVTALDALLVINSLGTQARGGEGEAASSRANENAIKLDVNDDGRVSALDALMVINALNSLDSAELGTQEPDTAFAPSDLPSDSSLVQRQRDIDEQLLLQLALDALNARTF